MKIFFGLILLFLSSLIWAKPAPKELLETINPDGSSLKIRHFGDEHYHYTTTEDSLLIQKKRDGFYYLTDETGEAKVRAKNRNERTPKEDSVYKKIDAKKAKVNHRTKHKSSYIKTSTDTLDIPPVKKRPQSSSWLKGDTRFPVLLISTPTQKSVDSLAYYRLFNEAHYTLDGNIGSLRDYFLKSSNGEFKPHFDIFPIALSKNLSDYVDTQTGAFLEGLLMREGIDELVKRNDFDGTLYTSSGSNSVHGFLFLYPGKEEDALAIHDDFWAHQYYMRYNNSNNGRAYSVRDVQGKRIEFDSYVIFAQLADSRETKLNAMGIFVHEFSHILGLKDHYGADANGVMVYGPDEFDVMSRGMYNGNWQVPPKFSAFERESMGWLSLKELAPDSIYALPTIDSNTSYSLTNSKVEDEYYVIEYRPNDSYDNFLESHGIFIWYINYDSDDFFMNQVNNDPNNQRVALKKILTSGDFLDFKFNLQNAQATIEGIFNSEIFSPEISYFTTNKNRFVDEIFSSSSEEDIIESSSSTDFLNAPPETRYQVNLKGDFIKVHSQNSNQKVLRLFDVQGNLIQTEFFNTPSQMIKVKTNKPFIVKISEK